MGLLEVVNGGPVSVIAKSLSVETIDDVPPQREVSANIHTPLAFSVSPCVRTKGLRGHECIREARNARGESPEARRGNMPPMRQRCAEEAHRATANLVLAGMPESRVRGTPRVRSRCDRSRSSRPYSDPRAPDRHLRRPNAGVTGRVPSCGVRAGQASPERNTAVRAEVGFNIERSTKWALRCGV